VRFFYGQFFIELYAFFYAEKIKGACPFLIDDSWFFNYSLLHGSENSFLKERGHGPKTGD
jgi:hypothetical protein